MHAPLNNAEQLLPGTGMGIFAAPRPASRHLEGAADIADNLQWQAGIRQNT